MSDIQLVQVFEKVKERSRIRDGFDKVNENH